MTTIEFTVLGTPKPQGSKKAFAVNGQARMKEAGGLEFAAWRNAVAEAARREARLLPAALDGPLSLIVEFRFPMPASRRKADRARGRIPKTSAPDTSKLVRLIEDSLQAGGLIVDDARIVDLHAHKHEVVGWTGASIIVCTLPLDGTPT